jgi:phosphoglycolate phosphatase-like HAD superfamily hydrolase
MYRNIIWDLDGTLFDTYPAITNAFRAALADLGKDAPLDWIESLAKKSIGFCETTLAGHFQVSEEELDRRFVERYDQFSPDEQRPFPGVTTICGYICSIGGKNVIVTHRGKVGTAKLLSVHHLASYFAGALTRDDGYPKKPNPAAFEAVLGEYGLARAETLAVGDRDIDMQAGRAAGLFTCLFGAYTKGGDSDLEIRDFGELHRYLVAVNG